MFSWGVAINGELGQGGLEDAHIAVPSPVPFSSVEVVNISPGGRHTLMLTSRGEVFTCGSNDFGQLGREGSQTRLQQVTGLSQYTVVQISAGANHSLAVDEWGSLFSWGSDEYGQLGHNQGAATLRVPRLVKSLGTLRVTAVAAGMYHSAALTASGQLFTWGSNSKGQLGLGTKFNMVFSPTLVDCLAGVPLAGLACGAHHSLVATVSGAVFAWGANSHGQLGLGDYEDRSVPTQVRMLRNQRISYCGLAAGSEHSVALTVEGGVFTWGSSRCGQLGHGVAARENLPRRVLELMGTEVSQVAAGDRHTLALVPSRNRLYAFGVGGSGQLGRGPAATENANLPQLVQDANGLCMESICLVAAGGNTSWAVTASAYPKQESAVPQRSAPAVSQLTPAILAKVVSVAEDELMDQDLMQYLETVFSSLACLNGSLLMPNHYGCRGTNHGVDLAAWRSAFETVSKCAHDSVSSLVLSGLLTVMEQLRVSPPDVEALRIYLILPLHPGMREPSNAKEFHMPFAEHLLRLQGPALKVVEKWIGTSCSMWLTDLVTAYKTAVLPFLQMLRMDHMSSEYMHALSVFLVFLTFLGRINAEHGYPVSYETFYIPNLHQICDLKLAYLNWRMAKQQGRDITADFYICNFPFIFDPAAKEVLLRADQEFSQRIAQQSAFQNAFFQMVTSGQGILNPFLEVMVSRNNLVQDTINQLAMVAPSDLKKPLRVKFVGEEAEDAGGVTKEFFLLLIKEILNPDYGMFREYESSRTIWFSPSTFEELGYFHLIGIMCGLAIYNFTIINVPFPLVLYTKLLDKKAVFDLSDLSELDPCVAKSMQDLLNYTGEDVEEVFSLNFTIAETYFGEVVNKPLKPDGENIPVTQANKEEFVKLYVDHVLNKSCEAPFEAFKKGFMRVVNNQVLQLFHAKELMALVVGNENYNWEMLEQNCQYKEGYSADHPTIQHFWQVFRDLSEEDKRKFLLFLTGSDRIPIRGMESVQITIQKTKDTNFLPVAHTCFNLLDLPEYGTIEKTRYKLLQAIQCTQGFGLV